jgi:HSP20 family protein
MLSTIRPATRLVSRQVRSRALAPAIRAYKTDPSSSEGKNSGKKDEQQQHHAHENDKAAAVVHHHEKKSPVSSALARAPLRMQMAPSSLPSMLRAMDSMMSMDPFRAMDSMMSMDPFFARAFADDDFFAMAPLARRGDASASAASPALLPLDIHDEDGKYVVKADLPGVDKKDVAVEVSPDGQFLTISGSRSEEHREGGQGGGGEGGKGGELARPLRVERRWSSWSRSLALSPDVDADAVKASLKEGVLCVELPKKRPAEPEHEEPAPKRVAVE